MVVLIISVKNERVLMAGDIGNYFCTAPCIEKILFTCGQEFGAKFVAIVVLKHALYALKTTSNSLHNLFSALLRDICFNPSRSKQDLCLRK